jgi:Sigma-70 region 2
MASTSAAIEGDLRRLFDVGAVTGLTDNELLERFLRRDSGFSAAFEAIIARHGPVVWSACNHYGPAAWSEDVFQATFLILIGRTGALRLSGSLGPWLVEVARRTALKAWTAGSQYRSPPGRPRFCLTTSLPRFELRSRASRRSTASRSISAISRGKLTTKPRSPSIGRSGRSVADWPALGRSCAADLLAVGSHRRDGSRQWG